jgi:hypothetical protein
MLVRTTKPTDSVEDEGIRNLPPLPPHRHPIPSGTEQDKTRPLLDSSSPPSKQTTATYQSPSSPTLTSAVPLLQVQVPKPSFSINLNRRTGSLARGCQSPSRGRRNLRPPSSQKTDCWIPGTSLNWLRMVHRWACFIFASLAMWWEFSACGAFLYFKLERSCQQC